MSSQIALLLCAAFVIFLLRIERKQTPDVSAVLWVPTVWLLYTSSRPMGTWLRAVAEDAPSSPLDQLFLGGLLFLGLLVLSKRNRDWPNVARAHHWLIVVVGYMFLSVMWSDMPATSFRRCVRELAAVTMALVVATERNPRVAAECLLRRMVCVHIPVSLLLIKYFPDYGIQFGTWFGEMMWTGVSTQKNGLGILCFVSAVLIVWTLIRRWQGRLPYVKYQIIAYVVLLGMTLVLLRGPRGSYGTSSGYSSSSVGALAAGLATFLGLSWLKKRGRFLGTGTLGAIMGGIILYGTVLPLGINLIAGGLTAVLGRDATLTGRTEIWAELLPNVEKEPLLGCGFGGYWTPERREAHRVGQTHNGYLAVVLELGFVGLLLLSAFLISSGRKAARMFANDFDWASLCVCFLLMALIHNITEASINSFTTPLTAVLLLLVMGIPTRQSPEPISEGCREMSDSQVSPNETEPSHAWSNLSGSTDFCGFATRGLEDWEKPSSVLAPGSATMPK
jgi:exopolysaccharide production protein ExoQ